MKWKDLENSTELAEVLGLVASLVAAVVALKDAQKENEDEEQIESDGSAKSHAELIQTDKKPIARGQNGFILKHKVRLVLGGLFSVVVLQLAIILFIAYKLL